MSVKSKLKYYVNFSNSLNHYSRHRVQITMIFNVKMAAVYRVLLRIICTRQKNIENFRKTSGIMYQGNIISDRKHWTRLKFGVFLPVSIRHTLTVKKSIKFRKKIVLFKIKNTECLKLEIYAKGGKTLKERTGGDPYNPTLKCEDVPKED